MHDDGLYNLDDIDSSYSNCEKSYFSSSLHYILLCFLNIELLHIKFNIFTLNFLFFFFSPK